MKERKREMKREKEKEKESAREEKILTSSANEGSLSKAKKRTTEKTFFIFFCFSDVCRLFVLFVLFFSFVFSTSCAVVRTHKLSVSFVLKLEEFKV